MADREESTARTIVEVAEYDSEGVIRIAPTQLGSQYSTTRKRRIVDEWVNFLSAGPSPIAALYLPTRVPQRLFEALRGQTQLETLQVKWGDYCDLSALSGMKQLIRLRLRGASKVSDLGPLAALRSVVTLEIEGLSGLIDASPIGQLDRVTTLAIGGNWMTPKNVRLSSVDFLRRMPQLKRLLLHTLIVNDLDYRPLLALPNLDSVRVMAARGMIPSMEELVAALPWES